jgi:hypothetical protein
MELTVRGRHPCVREEPRTFDGTWRLANHADSKLVVCAGCRPIAGILSGRLVSRKPALAPQRPRAGTGIQTPSGRCTRGGTPKPLRELSASLASAAAIGLIRGAETFVAELERVQPSCDRACIFAIAEIRTLTRSAARPRVRRPGYSSGTYCSNPIKRARSTARRTAR